MDCENDVYIFLNPKHGTSVQMDKVYFCHNFKEKLNTWLEGKIN